MRQAVSSQKRLLQNMLVTRQNCSPHYLSKDYQRIVSLVPSQTELLYALGLRDTVVAITTFCVHPAEWHKHKKRIGGTKNLHVETIRNLQPDLILANKEENDRQQILDLATDHLVWMTDIYDLNDAVKMILDVGIITKKQQAAEKIVHSIHTGFNTLHPVINQSVAYFIWKKPYMVAARNTFIDDMLRRCGWHNVFDSRDRYPVLTVHELSCYKPNLVFLSSEPYPFREKHIAEFREIFPSAEILLTDGEMFSWYGSRLIDAAEYFKTLIQSTSV